MKVLLDENVPESVRAAQAVRATNQSHGVKVILVTLAQAPREQFTRAFVDAFQISRPVPWARRLLSL